MPRRTIRLHREKSPQSQSFPLKNSSKRWSPLLRYLNDKYFVVFFLSKPAIGSDMSRIYSPYIFLQNMSKINILSFYIVLLTCSSYNRNWSCAHIRNLRCENTCKHLWMLNSSDDLCFTWVNSNFSLHFAIFIIRIVFTGVLWSLVNVIEILSDGHKIHTGNHERYKNVCKCS